MPTATTAPTATRDRLQVLRTVRGRHVDTATDMATIDALFIAGLLRIDSSAGYALTDAGAQLLTEWERDHPNFVALAERAEKRRFGVILAVDPEPVETSRRSRGRPRLGHPDRTIGETSQSQHLKVILAAGQQDALDVIAAEQGVKRAALIRRFLDDGIARSRQAAGG